MSTIKLRWSSLVCGTISRIFYITKCHSIREYDLTSNTGYTTKILLRKFLAIWSGRKQIKDGVTYPGVYFWWETKKLCLNLLQLYSVVVFVVSLFILYSAVCSADCSPRSGVRHIYGKGERKRKTCRLLFRRYRMCFSYVYHRSVQTSTYSATV